MGIQMCVFIGDVWHYLLKSLDPQNINGTYDKYRQSPAWQRKREMVKARDAEQCVCGAAATEVHHKTYDNIGKESLSDLVILCEDCHKKFHKKRVPSDPQQAVKEAFIAYVDRESAILRHADFVASERPDYVVYESGYQKEKGYHEIWLSAWIPADHNKVAAVIVIRSDSSYFQSHYKKFKKHKDGIVKTFSFEDINSSKVNETLFHLRVEKKNVDLTQADDRDAAFRWLRENLEKLYWVLRVQETLGWDTT